MPPPLDASDYPGALGMFDSEHAADVARAQCGGPLVGVVGYAKGWDPWQSAICREAAQVLWGSRFVAKVSREDDR